MAGRPPARDSAEQIQSALEGLLRLSASRRVHARQLAAADVGLSRAAYTLLRRVHESGPLPMGELARAAAMDPGATARQVAQLEADGLLVRSPSPDDRRVSLVSVTRRGETVRLRVKGVLEQHLQSVLDGWSGRDRETFARLLGRFVDGLRERDYEPAGDATGAAGPEVA